MSSNNISWLTTVPASDGNFKLHLQYATLEELKESVSILTEKGTKGNIARINALNREIRKRCKKPEKLKKMPKQHPFENAELCELYCYDDTPTYVAKPAYDAFTYPTYDRDSQSFLYRHYDMEAETSDDVSVDLIELLEAHIDDDFLKAIEICNMFNVPAKDIKACQEEVLKMCNSCEAQEA